MVAALQEWGPLAGMVGIVITLITVWIKGIPARLLAKSAGDATLRGEEKGLREWLKAELKECQEGNDERDAKLKAIEKQHKKDMKERDEQHARDLKERDDRIFQLEVFSGILLRRALISDPDDEMVKGAKAVLELNAAFPIDPTAIKAAIERLKGITLASPKSTDAPKSPALEAAEQTVECAEQTVAEVKSHEKPSEARK